MKQLTIILIAGLASLSGFSQEVVVRSKADSVEITIGDQINYDIYVDASAGTAITFPTFSDTLSSQIEIVETSLIDTTTSETGDLTFHQRLVLTSFDTGYLVIPPVMMMVNSDTGNIVNTEPELIYVYDVEVDLQQDIKDIKEPEEVPPNWWKYFWWILGFHLLAGLIFLIHHLLTKNRDEGSVAAPSKPKRPAHETALAELERIKQQQLWQNDQVKEHHSAVTEVLRQYIEDRFHLPALEQTTDEIMESLRSVNLSDEMRKKIKDTLVMADLVKFAKSKPVGAENEICMNTTIDLIKETLVMPLDDNSNESENERSDVG